MKVCTSEDSEWPILRDWTWAVLGREDRDPNKTVSYDGISYARMYDGLPNALLSELTKHAAKDLHNIGRLCIYVMPDTPALRLPSAIDIIPILISDKTPLLLVAPFKNSKIRACELSFVNWSDKPASISFGDGFVEEFNGRCTITLDSRATLGISRGRLDGDVIAKTGTATLVVGPEFEVTGRIAPEIKIMRAQNVREYLETNMFVLQMFAADAMKMFYGAAVRIGEANGISPEPLNSQNPTAQSPPNFSTLGQQNVPTQRPLNPAAQRQGDVSPQSPQNGPGQHKLRKGFMK